MLARILRSGAIAATALGLTALVSAPTLAQTPAVVAADTHYRSATIDGVEVAYREAGPQDAPAVLLLHGFPTSSRMFRDLIPALADRYHLIAPDYPGFGRSPRPTGQRSATLSQVTRN